MNPTRENMKRPKNLPSAVHAGLSGQVVVKYEGCERIVPRGVLVDFKNIFGEGSRAFNLFENSSQDPFMVCIAGWSTLHACEEQP